VKIDAGFVTNQNAPAVVEAGRAAMHAGDFVIDFSGVTRCDTAAVACILEWHRAARAAKATLRLVGLPPEVHSLAKLYGVDGLVGGE